MGRERSTLRLGALYRARGMISLHEYREFRRRYVQALLEGAELPELPAAWHELTPGTHTQCETQETPVAEEPPRGSPRRALVLVLLVLAAAAGTLAWYLALN